MAEQETVTERDPRNRLYELLYIVPNKYTEEEVPQIQTKVKGIIEKSGGQIKKDVNYGKRRLAYPVKHNHYGYYLLHHFEMPSKATKELEETLRVQDEILRHLITIALPEGSLPEDAGDLRQPEEKQTKQPQKQEEPASKKKPSITDAKVTKEEKEKIAKGSVFNLEKELGVTAEEAKEALETEGKEKSKKDESVDLKQLDTKLDEIMGDLDKKE
jgi:small subunit ribosomal protein S6